MESEIIFISQRFRSHYFKCCIKEQKEKKIITKVTVQ